jgi:hypothetical protein
MLDDCQQKALTLLMEGKMTKTQIAKIVGKSRQWLYDNVVNDEEAKLEVDVRLQEIQIFGINSIKSNLKQSIANIITLANSSESEKIRMDANTYLVDRVLGRTTTKLEVENTTDKEEVSPEQLEDEFSQFKMIE